MVLFAWVPSAVPHVRPAFGAQTIHPEAIAMDEARVIAHVFLMVLIAGTIWRLASYHLIAASQPHLNHLGLAMAQQY
jgi:hypothetical protein